MARADAIVIGAGALAFTGNFMDAGGWPSNGYTIIGATVALAFLASLTNNTPISGAAAGLAGLMLLAAVIRYVPGLANRKGKNNG